MVGPRHTHVPAGRAAHRPIITVKKLQFRDFDPAAHSPSYDDWRLTAKHRATDLVGQMTPDQKTCLLEPTLTRWPASPSPLSTRIRRLPTLINFAPRCQCLRQDDMLDRRNTAAVAGRNISTAAVPLTTTSRWGVTPERAIVQHGTPSGVETP